MRMTSGKSAQRRGNEWYRAWALWLLCAACQGGQTGSDAPASIDPAGLDAEVPAPTGTRSAVPDSTIDSHPPSVEAVVSADASMRSAGSAASDPRPEKAGAIPDEYASPDKVKWLQNQQTQALPNGRLLIHDRRRGLTIIDAHVPEAPHIEGFLEVGLYPQATYRSGDQLWMIVQSPYGYSGMRTDIPGPHVPSPQQGNALMVAHIDIADPTASRWLDTWATPFGGGPIYSVAAQRGDGVVLYVAACTDAERKDCYLRSFRDKGGQLEVAALSELGPVRGLQAEADALVIAHASLNGGPERVRVFDANASADAFTERASWDLPGSPLIFGQPTAGTAFELSSPFEPMTLQDGILRVVSLGGESTADTRPTPFFVSSFSVTGETMSLGTCEQLLEGRFLDQLFFTPQAVWLQPRGSDTAAAPHRVVSTQGDCQSESRTILADLATANSQTLVLAGTAALSLTYDEATGSAPRLALYHLDPAPGQQVAESASTMATTALRLTVVENQVTVAAADGTPESHLALVYGAAELEVFSFSATTLTRRGRLSLPDTYLRRVDPLGEGQVLLSSNGLHWLDLSQPDEPVVIGSIAELAPQLRQAFEVQGHLLRVRVGAQPAPSTTDPRQAEQFLEVLAQGANPWGDEVVASLPAQPGTASTFLPLEDRFVVQASTGPGAAGTPPNVQLQIYDFADPLTPRARGQVSAPNLALGLPDTRMFPGSEMPTVVDDPTLVWQIVRSSGQSDVLNLFRLNLQDPDAPSLVPIVTQSEVGGRFHGVRDGRLFYSFDAPASQTPNQSSNAAVQRTVRAIDLQSLSQVEQVVPGELLAFGAQVFYTVERHPELAGQELVHRFEEDASGYGQTAEAPANASISRSLIWVTHAGRLAWYEHFPFDDDRSQVVVLGEQLNVAGVLPLEPYSYPVAYSPDYLLYRARGGLFTVALSGGVPELHGFTPALMGYFAGDSLHGHYQNGSFWVAAGRGGAWRSPVAVRNLVGDP